MSFRLSMNALLLLPFAIRTVAAVVDEASMECLDGAAGCGDTVEANVHLIQQHAPILQDVKGNTIQLEVDMANHARTIGAGSNSAEFVACVDEWTSKLRALGTNNTACTDQCGSAVDTERTGAQPETYASLAAHASVNTVCETGFFLGESTTLWLCANPNLHVYSFDLQFPEENLKLLQEGFPGRLTAFPGDSRETLTKFAEDTANPFCDIMIADGGHYEDIPGVDMANFAKIAAREPAREHVLLIDEVFFINDKWYINHNEEILTMSMTSTYVRMLNAGEFDPSKSRCVSYAGQTFPIVGNTTLESAKPHGGWCELGFAL